VLGGGAKRVLGRYEMSRLDGKGSRVREAGGLASIASAIWN